MRASAYVVLRQFLLLDTNGQGRLSFASWCQGILAQPQLLQCFTLSLPPPPLHPVSSTESMTQGRLSAEHSDQRPPAISSRQSWSGMPWVESMLSADVNERSAASAEHAMSAVFLGRPDLLTAGVRDALIEDGLCGGCDASLRADARGNWVFAGHTFAKRSLLPIPIPSPPRTLVQGPASADAEDSFVGTYGFPGRHALRGHAVSRNFWELAAGDTLLEMTLKSRGARPAGSEPVSTAGSPETALNGGV